MRRRVVLAVCATAAVICAAVLVRTEVQQWVRAETVQAQRTTHEISAGTEQEWIVRQVLSSIVALASVNRPASETRPLVIVTTEPIPGSNPYRDATFSMKLGGC